MAKTVPVNKTIKKNSARVSGAEKASIKAGLKKHPNRKQKPIDKPSQKKRIQKTITLQPLSLEQQLAQLGPVHDRTSGDARLVARHHVVDAAVVDLLLDRALDAGRARRLLVEHAQAQAHPQRGRVRQAAELALLDVERRLAELEADELEPRAAGMRGDREDRRERRATGRHDGASLGRRTR